MVVWSSVECILWSLVLISYVVTNKKSEPANKSNKLNMAFGKWYFWNLLKWHHTTETCLSYTENWICLSPFLFKNQRFDIQLKLRWFAQLDFSLTGFDEVLITTTDWNLMAPNFRQQRLQGKCAKNKTFTKVLS